MSLSSGEQLRKREKEKSESEESDEDVKPKPPSPSPPIFPDDCFNMVTQSHWESAIIWDGQDAQVKKLSKNKAAGWVPSGANRSAQKSIGGSGSPFGTSSSRISTSSLGSTKGGKG
jgi:hypothetical protein